ncbi:MAG: hypothetical protein ACKOJF_11045, partial [Planctomycetaceae bacterium]
GELGPAAPPGGFSSLLREPARVVGSVGLLLLICNIGSEQFWWRGALTDVTAFTRLALPMALVAAWVATLFDGTRARSVPPLYLSVWGLAWVFATQGHDSVGLKCDRLLSAQAVLTGCCGLLWL